MTPRPKQRVEIITARQLRTLQTLYGLYAERTPIPADADARAARLGWAAEQLGHQVASFKDLLSSEAARLIDALKEALGQKPKRRRMDRDEAMAFGTHGRRGLKVKVQVMARPEDVQEIDRLRERVGMTREGFETWLRSRQSPLCGREDARLLTVSDCNRVRWALRAMLRRAAAGVRADSTEKSLAKSS